MESDNKIFDIINKVLEDKDIQIEQNEMATGLLNVDSITFIKIIVALEEAFDFEFDDEMLLITKFPTVESMILYVKARISI